MVGQQIRANADHYWGEGAEFLMEQFAFHPFSQLGGLPQAVRVFGTEARMAALVASLNEHIFSGIKAGSSATAPAAPSPSSNAPY
jgi:type I restriction enzyme R subunit